MDSNFQYAGAVNLVVALALAFTASCSADC